MSCVSNDHLYCSISFSQYNIGVITNEGSEIQGPFNSVGTWDIAHYVSFLLYTYLD